jgi:hypothetical protein
MIHLLHRSEVDGYFSGTLEARAVTAMFERLWRCGACRARYERHLLLERALPGGVARGAERLWESITRTAAVGASTAAVRAGASAAVAPATRERRRAAILAASLAVAVVALLPFWPKTRPEFVSRGAPGVAPAPSLHLYRTRGGKSERVESEIGADDGVLLAYSNPSTDLGYLMVFAVDEKGGVHWYYPGYERLGDDPAAVAIRTGALGVELGEEIRHQLPTGDLRMFALFLPRPRRVLEVEAAVASALAARGGRVRDLAEIPLPEGEQTSRLLTVRP